MRSKLSSPLLLAVTVVFLIFPAVGVYSGELLDKEASQHWFSKGKYFHDFLKDNLRASESLKKALEADPSNRQARDLLNQIRGTLDLPPEVRAIDSENSRGWLLRARYQADFKKDLKGAIESLERSMLYDPGNAEARSLLDKVREKLQYSLEMEHSLGVASQEFRRGDEKVLAGDYVSALEAYRKGLDTYRNNTRALIAFFRIATWLDRGPDIEKALDLIRGQAKFGLTSSGDVQALRRELDCLANRIAIQRSVVEYNRDTSMMEAYFDTNALAFLPRVPDAVQKYRLALKPMTVLDLQVLLKRGYISSIPRCSDPAAIYFQSELGRIECTVHSAAALRVRGLELGDKNYIAVSAAGGSAPTDGKGPETASFGSGPASPEGKSGPDFPSRTNEAAHAAEAMAERETVKSREVFNASIALGDVSFSKNDLDSALKQYERARTISPEDPLPYMKKGNVLYFKGSWDEAHLNYRIVVEKDPFSHEGYNNIGNCLAELGKAPEAIESYQKALSLKPDFGQANYNLGLQYMKAGDFAKAEESLARACEITPDDFSARYYLARTLVLDGRYRDALEQLKTLRRSVDRGSGLERVVRDLETKIEAVTRKRSSKE